MSLPSSTPAADAGAAGREAPGPSPADLLEGLRRQGSAMERLLEALVACESPSGDTAAQERMLRLIAAEAEQRGLVSRIHRPRDGQPLLLAAPRERLRGRPLQVVVGHCDTVWPAGTLEEMPVERRDDRLHGPGTFDMKGGLVQVLFALEAALAAAGGKPPVTPVLLVTSDEETGSEGSRTNLVRLARIADRVLVAEPALGLDGHLKTARKGIGRFTVTIEGRAAHAGLDPEQGASAILALSDVVQRLHALGDPERGTTVNVGTIDGGLSPNVVAPRARAEVDVRVLTREEGERVDAAVHALESTLEGTRLTVTGGMERPPMEPTPGNRRLWELARRAAEELGLALDEATAGGASDGNFTSLHAPTLDGLGAVGEGAHAAHENVVIERLPERAALLARLLLAPPLGAIPSS